MAEPEEEKMTVKLKTMTGEEFSFDAAPNETVLDLKVRIAAEKQCPVEAINIMNGKSRLKDNLSLEDFEIKGILRIIIRLMNVITIEFMQGEWWKRNGASAVYKSRVEGNSYFDPNNRRYDFKVTEEGFGYDDHWIATPTSIVPGVIRTIYKSSQGEQVWARTPELANLHWDKLMAENEKERRRKRDQREKSRRAMEEAERMAAEQLRRRQLEEAVRMEEVERRLKET